MIATETEISYFLELYTIRQFTHAAMKLRVSQSALTQSISKLESKVGAPLFYRTKKGCTPTPSGELFYQHAQQLLENWRQLTKTIQLKQQSVSGRFRLGCHSSLAIYALPGLLKQLGKKAPGIEVALIHDYSKNLIEKIISYELDLALVVNPPKHNDLVLNKIYGDRICVWKSKAVKEPPKEIFTDMTRAEVQKFFGKRYAHFKDWKITESTSLELVRGLVAEGVGVGILPERVAKAEETNLELFDKSLPTYADEIFVIHRYDTLKSRAGSLLRDVARGSFKLQQ